MITDSIWTQFWTQFWDPAKFPLFQEVLWVLIPLAILAWWWQRDTT
jgi:hypothetical protein